jgi:hypothetical protein
MDDSKALYDHWKYNAQQWQYVGPPLKPMAQDVDFVEAAISEWCAVGGRTNPTILVLGVTPELCRLSVKVTRNAIAIDRCAAMTQTAYMNIIGLRPPVVRGEWLSMPLVSSSVDLIIGDGFLINLSYPSGQSRLFAEFYRLLRPGGRCFMRCFVQSDKPETTNSVFADLSAGLIRSFHILKWRLVMASQRNAVEGIPLQSVWNLLSEKWPDLDQLARRFNWPTDEVRTIEVYRKTPARFHFPTLAQYRDFLPTVGFSVLDVITPSYELGEVFPTILLERR